MNTLPRPNFNDPDKGPANCLLTENLEVFFAEADMPRTPEAKIYTEQAKKVCNGCPYKIACGAYALDHPEERGVWGGFSEEERRSMRRRMAGAR